MRRSLLTLCVIFGLTLTSCCFTGRPDPVLQTEFESMKVLQKGEKAPGRGFWMNMQDARELGYILAEIERKTSNNN